MIVQAQRKRGLLLATGQTTSYGSGTGVDDGALQKGIIKTYTILTLGQYSGTTAITINSKTETKSNNCVEDNNTGLMWSRYQSASVGPNSNGTLPWTTNAGGEGIFSYCAAANAAALAGYSDWRVCNFFELVSLMARNGGTAEPNPTAFPTILDNIFWTSTTDPVTTTSAIPFNFYRGAVVSTAKTTAIACILVRG